MPIRINLLAEAQAAEEARRKDPVKRAIWVGSFLVAITALWFGKLFMDVQFERSNLNKVNGTWTAMQSNFTFVNLELTNTAQTEAKIAKLDELSTNRFLWAPVLNAMQKSMINDIEITRLRSSQKVNRFVPDRKSKARPGMVLATGFFIDAKDLKPDKETYKKYKETLCNYDYFVKGFSNRDGFLLEDNLSAPVVDPQDSSKSFVTFSLDSHFPDHKVDE